MRIQNQATFRYSFPLKTAEIDVYNVLHTQTTKDQGFQCLFLWNPHYHQKLENSDEGFFSSEVCLRTSGGSILRSISFFTLSHHRNWYTFQTLSNCSIFSKDLLLQKWCSAVWKKKTNMSEQKLFFLLPRKETHGLLDPFLHLGTLICGFHNKNEMLGKNNET